jgi:hypothetical protein
MTVLQARDGWRRGTMEALTLLDSGDTDEQVLLQPNQPTNQPNPPTQPKPTHPTNQPYPTQPNPPTQPDPTQPKPTQPTNQLHGTGPVSENPVSPQLVHKFTTFY